MNKYGWKRDLPDHRDHRYAFVGAVAAHIDLRPQYPPVYDQGQLGSCTANAIAAALQFDEIMMKQPDAGVVPSRLFIYYNERALEGTVKTDSGAAIRDGIKVVNRIGACPETLWPYDITKFKVKPKPQCYNAAKFCEALQYYRIEQVLNTMLVCLSKGFPFVIGISVYESFEGPEVAKTGVVPMPEAGEALLGGHAMLAVGYDVNRRTFIVRNSWGAGWGDKGYGYLPFDYLVNLDLAADFWTICLVS